MAAESVMRAIIGQTPIQEALTSRRKISKLGLYRPFRNLCQNIEQVYKKTSAALAVLPPKNVIDAFDEVSRARQDMTD